MRLFRTIAAVIAIVLGLACVSLAAFGADAMKSVTPNSSDDERKPSARALPPLDPEAGNTETRMWEGGPVPDSFKSEFGQRGKHEVTVSVTGGAVYGVTWRDQAEPKWGVGNFSAERTVNGGFPLVQVVMQNKTGRNSTCVVTVDGIEKDRQSTSTEHLIQVCEG